MARAAARFAAVVALVVATSPARGQSKGALVRDLGQGARIDWTRGLLVARGAAAADLRAPSPQVARLAAERRARAAGQARLRQLARDLRLADGRSLGSALDKDKAAAGRLDRAIARSVDVAIDHASDGSVVLSTALPVEAARAAIAGFTPAPAGAVNAPTALVVTAGKHLARPAVGVSLGAGGERYSGPTLFASREAAMADRLGPRPVRLKAAGGRAGSLELGGKDAARQLAAARAAGALVVILVAETAEKPKSRKPRQ